MTLHFKYHDLFAQWRTQCAKALNEGFAQQLEAADKVLMEFADKAENINVQNHFFDAQREIWLKTDDMRTDFSHLLEKQLEKSYDTKSKDSTTREDEVLDLLNLDIYEKTLALKTLAEKAVLQNQHALYSLHQRLTVINNGVPIKLENIPATPEQICSVFSTCIDRLRLENDALMVLYTLFDKYVLCLLPDIYDALNQQLIKMGILPTLKYQVRIAANLGIPQKDHASPAILEAGNKSVQNLPQQEQSTADLGNETLVRIMDLLSINRTKTNPKAPLPTGVKAATTQEIINTVSTLPEDSETSLPAEIALSQPIDKGNIDRSLLGRIQISLSNQRLKVKQTVGRDRISDQQEDVIDIVGMLFEQILDNPSIPGIAKAILGHLHTPYIKIGLQDEALFNSAEHPARIFLNQAMDASASWIDEDDLKQGIYPLLKNIVQQVIRFRRQEQGDFIEFQHQLDDEIKRLLARSQLLEKRSQETEKGKSHLDKAKDMARRATEKIFAGEKITPDCKQFIDEVWVDFLTLVLLRNQGKQNTNEWLESQKLATHILTVSHEAANDKINAQSINQLFADLTAQVGSLLPHQITAIERFILSLSTIQKPSVIMAAEDKINITAPPVEQIDSNLYQELRELPPNTWFQFNLDMADSTRAKLSWYNGYSDRFLFVDQSGKKICLKSIAELVTEVTQGTSVYFLEPKRSFWDAAMSAIKKLLENPTQK